MGILDESSKILKLKELKLKCIHYFTLQGYGGCMNLDMVTSYEKSS